MHPDDYTIVRPNESMLILLKRIGVGMKFEFSVSMTVLVDQSVDDDETRDQTIL